MQKLILVAGNVTPVPQATLTDVMGNPLDLSGATVRFQMVNFYSRRLYLNLEATVIQNDNNQATWGQVAYYWKSADTREPGLYQTYFVIDYGNGPSHFPADGDYFVLIRPGPGSDSDIAPQIDWLGGWQ